MQVCPSILKTSCSIKYIIGLKIHMREKQQWFVLILFVSGDLFPALDVPRRRDLDFEIMIKTAALDLKLQPDDGFVLKVPLQNACIYVL